MSKTVETTTPEVKTPVLKDDILAMAADIEKAMTIDANTGIVTTESDIYARTLSHSDLTIEQANAVHAHDTKFVAAAAHAIGQIAVNAMASSKDLQSAETAITMAGKNSLGITVERERSYPNPKDKTKPITKQGVVSVTYDLVADNNGGQLKIARSIIGELAAAALK